MTSCLFAEYRRGSPRGPRRVRPVVAGGAATLLVALWAGAPAAAQDTVVVRADNAPAWGRDLYLVEEMRIGSLDGDERTTFGFVAGVAVREDDQVWVADGQVPALFRFDDRGRPLEPVGRGGAGPGEFLGLSGVRRLPDGSMATWDQRLFRVNIFDADGTFLRSFPVPTNVMIGGLQVFQSGDDGSVWVMTFGKPPGEEDNYPSWMRMNLDGRVVYTLDGVPSGREGPLAFPVRNVQALSPRGYVVVGRNDRWAVSHPLPDSRVLRIERDAEAVPFGLAERREARRRERFFAVERWGREPQPIPRAKPIVKELEVDQEGRIWVRLHAEAIRVPQTDEERARDEELPGRLGGDLPPPREWREQVVYDVVEADGRYLGRVTLPYWDSQWMAAQGRRLWVVQTGEYGEQYVVQYKVVERN